MVNYGVSLVKARRPGWEQAYLDYEGLKCIRSRLEALLVEKEADIAANLDSVASDSPYLHKYFELRNEFANKLHSETEKITLFSLARLGELANAVGVLRVMTGGSQSSGLNACQTREDEEAPMDYSKHNYDEVGEKSTLLPSSDERSIKSPSRRSFSTNNEALFSRSKLNAIIGREFNDKSDKISVYSDLGVELLHILKYTCVNAAGIRKISKKYAKLISFFSVTRKADAVKKMEEHDLLMPKEIVQSYDAIIKSRIDQLTNNRDFATLFASLLDALFECEKDVSLSLGTIPVLSSPTSNPIVLSTSAMVKFLIESFDIPEAEALLRFECTISSIHTLTEFSRYASQPFPVFLSRRAMINTGKDQGELGIAEKKALSLLLQFEPDFILEMNESELRQWYIRATSKSRSDSTSKTSSAFIDSAAMGNGKQWGGCDGKSMIINLLSCLLYTVNYYIIAPTANHFATFLLLPGAFGASIIGAASFSAIFAAFLYSVWYTRFSFKSALAFSAFCPLIGNIIYTVAVTYKSIKMALLGRILCGFGSAEVVNRQLISACVSFQTMTQASALFVSISAAGMSVGPLIAAILDMTAGRDVNIDLKVHLPGSPDGSGLLYNNITAPGYLMTFLWALQLLCVLFLFEEPDRINGNDEDVENFISPSKHTKYGSVSDSDPVTNAKKKSILQDVMTSSRIIFSNVAFPVTLYLFAFIELSGEVLISSCSMIVRRYFAWYGSTAGFIIASLGALVIPAHYIVERASRVYSERQIMRYSILFVMFSCVAICNWEGLTLDIISFVLNSSGAEAPKAQHVKQVLNDSLHHNEFPYDWGMGKLIYLVFLSAIFIGSIILEGVNTSLMSKTAPYALNDSFLNMGLIATIVGTLGRVLGDCMIIASAIFGKAAYHDFVSVMYLPLLPILYLGLYLVNQNWKSLV